MARWSDPVNGLTARVDYVNPAGPAGFVVLVQLRNVSSSPLRVPMGNSPDSRPARLYELHKRDRKGEWHRAPWLPGEHLEGDGPVADRGGVLHAGFLVGQDIERPPVVLQPGEGALVYLWGNKPGGDERSLPLDLKVVLRLKAGQIQTVAKGLANAKGGPATAEQGDGSLASWTGVLETPAFPTHRASKLHRQRRGQLECPEYLPPFRLFIGNPLLQDMSEHQFDGICDSNFALNAAVELYRVGPMRSILEKRMANATSPLLRLMIAMLAVRMDSEAAMNHIRSCSQTAEWSEVREFHSALTHLLREYGSETPPWLLVLVEKVLTDDRALSVARSSTNGSIIPSNVLENATKRETLPLTLAYAKCPGAFSVLEANFKKYPSNEGLWGLRELRDVRAAPLLWQALRSKLADPKGQNPSAARLDEESLASAVAAARITDAAPLLMQLPESSQMLMALGSLGDLRARDYLQQMSENGIVEGKARPDLAFWASIALAALEPEKRTIRFEELLGALSNDERQMISVVSSMGALEDPRLIPLFSSLAANCSNKYVVRDSVMHLGTLKARQSVPTLLGIFDRQFDPPTTGSLPPYTTADHQVNIIRSLELISGKDFGMDRTKWLQWWTEQSGSRQ